MPRVEVLDSYAAVGAEEWDALVGDGSPFLEHTFLAGLQRTGCATAQTGWQPRPITVRDDAGTLVAAAPGWVKTHSMGEFVYDHAWADAASRASLPYYPKLVIAVPFTPVTGTRLLVRPGPEAAAASEALLGGLKAAATGTHGLHVLFDTEEEAALLESRGAFSRLQFQYHWQNAGYASFEDWLGELRSKTRNKLRRERREAGRFQIRCDVGPSAEVLQTMWDFYRNTCRQFGPWGRVYLGREFFRHLGSQWGHRLMVVSAWDGDTMVAGAFNVVKGDRLYGRYWGCRETHRFLHFEVCYYQAIAWCIEHGIALFEPGHGGGHKYRRGFGPSLTWSSHVLVDGRFHAALARHTADERAWVRAQAAELADHAPYKARLDLRD